MQIVLTDTQRCGLMYSYYRHSCGVTGMLTSVFASLPQQVPTESVYSHWSLASGVAEKLNYTQQQKLVTEGRRGWWRVSDPLKRVGGSFEKMLTFRVKFSRVWSSAKGLCGNSPFLKRAAHPLKAVTDGC